MRYRILRGENEIGGSCVEITTKQTRLLVDIGMPLMNPDGSEFDFKHHQNKTVKQLISEKILPNISGIYEGEKNLINGVLISHAHYDHFGFSQFLNPNIEYYLGKATHELIKITSLFTPNTDNINNVNYFSNEIPFTIGDIKITPYLVDHSAFDAYAFLIEAEGKTYFYSGDFRAHGRKAALFNRLIANPPKVDVLFMEGTTLGSNGDHKNISEIELQFHFEELFAQNKLSIVNTSSQNIDRIITIYKACLHTKKTLVIDLYLAYILEKLNKENPNIPFPGNKWKNIRVKYTQRLANVIAEEDVKELYKFTSHKIELSELNDKPEQFVLITRPFFYSYLQKHLPNWKNGNYIFSMWSGYKKAKNNIRFLEFLVNERNFKSTSIHTSGHADEDTLKRLVDALKPKELVPIHTLAPEEYAEKFKLV